METTARILNNLMLSKKPVVLVRILFVFVFMVSKKLVLLVRQLILYSIVSSYATFGQNYKRADDA